ncbi:MAG: TM0106 family RecB-like putative nuclease [Chloroflexi bacterium]|nr:TM0106 family RecB-like putative nuclease [Chloroflexota bacterium]
MVDKSSSAIEASDFYTLYECNRKVYLNHHGDPARQVDPDSFDEFLREQGIAYEADVVGTLEVEIPAYTPGDLQAGYQATLSLMQSGVALIYQGVLIGAEMEGLPDLLIRVDGPSDLGDYHYEPIDIKRSTKIKDAYRLQLMLYMLLLEKAQGLRPKGRLFLRPPKDHQGEALYVEERIDFDWELFNSKFAELAALVRGEVEPDPFQASICKGCVWRNICLPQVERTQDISLITGLKRSTWEDLRERGWRTLSDVADLDPMQLTSIKGVGSKTAERLVFQARALVRNEPVQVTPIPLQPSRKAIFFDIEGVPTEGIVYLLGTSTRRGNRLRYTYNLAQTPAQEEAMWRAFLERMNDTEGPIFHFGAFEKTTLRQLDERFGPDPRTAPLLRRLVDLEKIIKNCLYLPLTSYSLKQVAPWLGFEWGKSQVKTGSDSIQIYTEWSKTGDPALLDAILRYNEDDCQATAFIYDWLLTLELA